MRGLIGLDWGTSTLRAYRIDEQGRVEEARSRPWGIRQLPEGSFDAALNAITEHWPPDLPRFACGMVGSRNGWREAPYVDLPADPRAIVQGIVQVRPNCGSELHLVPGLRDPSGPDVLRGEETQLIGALSLQPGLAANSTWILPGTHSKWATVRNGCIVAFHTFMTGELFALLRHHSILGTREGPVAHDAQSFARGVIAARDSGAASAFSRLFSARTLMLEGALPAKGVPDYISGLLIGEEFRAALADNRIASSSAPQLLGDSNLCERYGRAAALFDINASPPLQGATAHGLWKLAVEARLTCPAAEASPPC